VHKAPANAVVEGALDTQTPLTEADHGRLNHTQVNCIRALPGRGIRLWGARTLSNDPAWRYVNVRRLFLTVGRWLERSLAAVAFEPHDVLLWARIERELRAYCTALFRAGALRGATEEEAFFVQCDATTNPPGSRDLGRVVADLGLAPVLPNEFVVVRLIQEASGVTLAPGR
jgi:phage tail sheath protein FI